MSAASRVYYHGTRSDLRVGDLLVPGYNSNFGAGKPVSWIYMSALLESATIAANGFRFRVPYGTLLCVSDKPLHGELKLPGMATEFYKRQVAQHLTIGIRAMEKLAEMPTDRLHSRKLRSFSETAFQ